MKKEEDGCQWYRVKWIKSIFANEKNSGTSSLLPQVVLIFSIDLRTYLFRPSLILQTS